MSAFIILLAQKSPMPPSITVQLASMSVVFHRRDIAGGGRQMVAEIGEGRGWAAAVQQARAIPRSFEIRGDVSLVPPEVIDKATVTEVANSLASNLPAPVAAAIRNGWEYADLDGAGRQQEWGDSGGRSLRSGLTMAEMALCSPPKGWGGDGDTRKPWEFDGWAGPTAAWRPPRVPSAEEVVAAPAPAPAPAPDPAPPPGRDDDPPSEAGDDDGDEDGTAHGTADGEGTDDPQAATNRALLAEYGAPAEVAEALNIVRSLAAEGGEFPSLQKASYYFRKAGLPSANSDQLTALRWALEAEAR